MKNSSGVVVAHSPTIQAALQTAKGMFGKIVAAEPKGKIIILYNTDAKICGSICKKSKAIDSYELKKQRQMEHERERNSDDYRMKHESED